MEQILNKYLVESWFTERDKERKQKTKSKGIKGSKEREESTSSQVKVQSWKCSRDIEESESVWEIRKETKHGKAQEEKRKARTVN